MESPFKPRLVVVAVHPVNNSSTKKVSRGYLSQIIAVFLLLLWSRRVAPCSVSAGQTLVFKNLLSAASVYCLAGVNETRSERGAPPTTRTEGSGRGRRCHGRRDGKLLLELLWSGYNSCGRKSSCCVYVCICMFTMTVRLHKSIYSLHVASDWLCCSGTLKKLPWILAAASWSTRDNELRQQMMTDGACFLCVVRSCDLMRTMSTMMNLHIENIRFLRRVCVFVCAWKCVSLCSDAALWPSRE